jgi:hypothetical protein
VHYERMAVLLQNMTICNIRKVNRTFKFFMTDKNLFLFGYVNKFSMYW